MPPQAALLSGSVAALVARIADLLVDGENVPLERTTLREDTVALLALVTLPVVGHVHVALEVEVAVCGVVALAALEGRWSGCGLAGPGHVVVAHVYGQ